jgi:YD repeat-containing protein
MEYMRMKVLAKLVPAFALFLLSSPAARAHVAVGNGNYFVGFTDIEHDAAPNTFMLKVQRNYNSRSQFDGLFGYGWGSDYEAFLLPGADGSVVIQENGSGDKTRFSPTDFSKADLQKHVDRIVEAFAKQNPNTRMSELREKLMNNANERDEVSRSLGIFPEPAPGTKLYSTQRGDKQTLSVVKVGSGIGYLREFSDGKREFFNVKVDVTDQGVDASKQRVLKGVYKVNRVADPVRKAQLFYEYDKKGRLLSVSDDQVAQRAKQILRFKFNEEGKVAEVSDKAGSKAFYEYCQSGGSAYNAGKKCGRGDLVRSKDTAGGIYSYQYDSIHNLIRIGNPKNGKPDQEFEEMTYWPAAGAGQGGVKSVKQTNGVLVEYKYWQDPSDKESHYKTDVKTTFTSGKAASTSYEYYEKNRADGSRYRYKLISVVDDEKTETIYNECCGQPLQVTIAGGTTKYEYFPGTGLPKERDGASENVRWEYSAKFHGKITKVVITDKAAKTVKSSEFEYDAEKGQLVKARTSAGKGILIFYDGLGRIASMVDQDKRKIAFKYSLNSKPSEIIQDGVGSIQVSYDKGGQIRDVKSKGGRQIAISVAAAFQNLLEIIKPAGIQPI